MQTPNPEPEPRGWRQKTPNPGFGKRGPGVESLLMSSSKICDKGLGLLESRVYRGASIYYVIKEWEGVKGLMTFDDEEGGVHGCDDVLNIFAPTVILTASTVSITRLVVS